MSVHAIYEMFHNQRGNIDSVTHGEKYQRFMEIATEKENALKEKLKDRPELLQLFTDTVEAIYEANEVSDLDYYYEGFRFGTLLGIDICTGKNE